MSIFLFECLKHPIITVLIPIIIFYIICISNKPCLLELIIDLILLYANSSSYFIQYWLSFIGRVLLWFFLWSPVINFFTFKDFMFHLLVYLFLSFFIVFAKMRTHSKKYARSIFNNTFYAVSIRNNRPRISSLMYLPILALIILMHL